MTFMIHAMHFSSNLNTMFILVSKAGADWQFWASIPVVYSAFYCQHMVLSVGGKSCGRKHPYF